MADDGGVSRRGFLKLMGGLASLPIAKQLGLDKLLLSEAASAPTSKPFAWGELVNLVKDKGDIVKPGTLGSSPFSGKMVYRLNIGNQRSIEVMEPTYSDITKGGDMNTYIDVFDEAFDIEGGSFDAPQFSAQIGQDEMGNPIGEVFGDAEFSYMGPEDAGDWNFESSGDFEGQNIDIDFADDFETILEEVAKAPIAPRRAEIKQKAENRYRQLTGKTNLPATKEQLKGPRILGIMKLASKLNLPLQIAQQLLSPAELGEGEMTAQLLEDEFIKDEIEMLRLPEHLGGKRHGGIVSINELVAA